MKIFSFPHVVIYELMEQFRPVELVALSFCSAKAQSFVKTFSKITEDLEIRSSKEYAYGIGFPSGVLIRVALEKDRSLDHSEGEAHQDFKYSFDKLGCFYTYWEDVVQGCRESINYICDLFKVPVATVSILHDADRWLLDFAQKRQEQKLKKVIALEKFHVSAEDFSKLISSNATEFLDCWAKPPRDYRFDGKMPSVKTLRIKYGSWIARKHVLGLQSQNTALYTPEITVSDVNVLLKSWWDGGLPNLRSLCLGKIKLNDQTNDDLVYRLERVQEEVYYKWDRVAPDISFNTNAFHIRRDDGVVATVQIWMRSFWMVVWPDLNGKCV